MAPPTASVTFTAADRRLVEGWAVEMIESLRRHGGGADGGVTRFVYSPEWQAAMEELEQWLDAAGLAVRVDAVGSRFGRLAGTEPDVVLAGSHVDAVLNGGARDRL